MKLGIVLEGGGMRGVFTAGILDYFLEQGLHIPYVIGVSAGANNGMSYVSNQIGRNRVVNIKYIDDKRFLSYGNLLKHGSVFGMDFIFNEIPNELEPFDYESFFQSPCKYVLGVTNIQTGQEEYYDQKTDKESFWKYLKASSSLPFIAKKVTVKGQDYMDGGVHDPIPVHKSIEDGNEFNIVILTQPKGYEKKPSKIVNLAKLCYSQYPKLPELLKIRHDIYNDTIKDIEKLEKQGNVFVFRPSGEINIDRMEKSKGTLELSYEEGYEQARTKYAELIKWIEENKMISNNID